MMIFLEPSVRKRLYEWHGGQFTPTYALASSGGGTAEMFEEAESELGRERSMIELRLAHSRSSADHRRMRGQIRSLENLIADLEMARMEQNPVVLPGAAVGAGLAVGLGLLAYLLFRTPVKEVSHSIPGGQVDVNPAPILPPIPIPDALSAVFVILGYPITVDLGTLIRIENDAGTGFVSPGPGKSLNPQSGDMTVLAKTTVGGVFFANKPGQSVVTGTYLKGGQKIGTASIVTVLPPQIPPGVARTAFTKGSATYVPLTPGGGVAAKLGVGTSIIITVPGTWLATMTSNGSVIAPSLPGSIDGFIAIRPGKATLLAVYDNNGVSTSVSRDIVVT